MTPSSGCPSSLTRLLEISEWTGAGQAVPAPAWSQKALEMAVNDNKGMKTILACWSLS